MRASRFFIHTEKLPPADAELASHRLMARAGFVRRLASGIYSWLPAGWRAARKVADIVREEMDAAGAAEVFLPAVQPGELWKQSGRWQEYGPELLRFADRHGREFCFGPTHEEVVTDIARAGALSPRRLPVNLYQIQTKFRDEIRPRFGVMRAREFIMKDAYSFDKDAAGMRESYEQMRRAYCRIFDRIGLRYRMVRADSGAIGGDFSHEFMVLADSGEEEILFCDETRFAANAEQTPCPPPESPRPPPQKKMEKISTPGIKTIDALAEFLPLEWRGAASVKTMLVRGDNGVAAVLLRGEDSLNLVKAAKVEIIGKNPRLLSGEEAKAAVGAGFGSLGPVNMPLPVVADLALMNAADFVCGANEDGAHFVGVNFGRDCEEPPFADLRFARKGDPAPEGEGDAENESKGAKRPGQFRRDLKLQSCRGIEVGHIFQLGDKYSKAMGALIDDAGGARPILMGCYGIGVTRIVAAAIEQGHDERGIIFPEAIAPFAAAIAPVGGARDEETQNAAARLYDDLRARGVDALLDDRALRPGAMFADLDLLGIPHRLIVGARSLKEGQVEYEHRTGAKENIPLETAAQWLAEKINAALNRRGD